MAACTTVMPCYRSVAEQIQASTTGVGRSGTFPLVSVCLNFEGELALRRMFRVYCFSRVSELMDSERCQLAVTLWTACSFHAHTPGSRRG